MTVVGTYNGFKVGPEGGAGLDDVGLVHPVPCCHDGGLQVVHIAVGHPTGFPLHHVPDAEVEGIQVWRGQWPHISQPKLANVVHQSLLCHPGLVCRRRVLLPHIPDPLELQIQPGFDHCLQHLLILLGSNLQPLCRYSGSLPGPLFSAFCRKNVDGGPVAAVLDPWQQLLAQWHPFVLAGISQRCWTLGV